MSESIGEVFARLGRSLSEWGLPFSGALKRIDADFQVGDDEKEASWPTT